MKQNDVLGESLGEPASAGLVGSNSPSVVSSGILGPQSGVPLGLSWGLLAILTLIFGAASLIFPFGRDQLLYAFIGDAILHGKTLYRDIPMMQLPLTGVVHALALLVFGHSMMAIRILDLFWTFAIAGFIFLLVRRMSGRDWFALTAALLYPAFYYTRSYWNTAQVDGFLNLPVAAGLYFAFRAMTAPAAANPHPEASSQLETGNTRLQFLLAGVLLGLALLFKYTILLVIPGLFLIVLLVYRPHYRQGCRTILWLALGIAMTLAGFIIVLAVSGGLGEFISYQWQVTLPYAREGSGRLGVLPRTAMLFRSYWEQEGDQFWPYLGMLGTILAIVAVLRPSTVDVRLRHGLALVLMWLGAALFSTFIQGKFFSYHYLVLAPPMTILIAFALFEAFRPLNIHLVRTGHRPILLGLALIGLMVLTGHYDRGREFLRVGLDKRRLEEFWTDERFRSPTFWLDEQMTLARYIGEHTAETDRIASFGIDPSLSFPFWREPVMRLSATLGLDPKQWTLHPEFEANPPDVIIIPHGDRISWVRGHNLDSYEQMMAFTAMRDFVAAHYEKETRIGRYDVLRQIHH